MEQEQLKKIEERIQDLVEETADNAYQLYLVL